MTGTSFDTLEDQSSMQELEPVTSTFLHESGLGEGIAGVSIVVLME